MPSRGFDVTTVLRMVVSPTRTSTAPSAWGASLPVSRVISSPAALMGPVTRMASAMGTLPLSPSEGRFGEAGRFPVVAVRMRL